MAFNLDRTIVPANDKEESVRFIARIFGLDYKGPWGYLAPVKANDTLTLEVDNQERWKKVLHTVVVRLPRTMAQSTTSTKGEASPSMIQRSIAGQSIPPHLYH